MSTTAMEYTHAYPASAGGDADDFLESRIWLTQHGFGAGLDASPSGGEPWKSPELPTPSGSMNTVRANYLISGTVAVLIMSAAAVYPGSSSLADLQRRPSDAARTPLSTPVVFDRQRRRETTEGQASDVVSVDTVRTAADCVDAIQDSLGLSITQIAGILGVERATVHNWLRTNASAPAKSQARTRLLSLSALATQWTERDLPAPRRLLTAALDEHGTTALDLLQAESWDEKTIISTMDALAQRMSENPVRRRPRNQVASDTRGITVPSESHSVAEMQAERVRSQLAVQRARRIGRRA